MVEEKIMETTNKDVGKQIVKMKGLLEDKIREKKIHSSGKIEVETGVLIYSFNGKAMSMSNKWNNKVKFSGSEEERLFKFNEQVINHLLQI